MGHRSKKKYMSFNLILLKYVKLLLLAGNIKSLPRVICGFQSQGLHLNTPPPRVSGRIPRAWGFIHRQPLWFDLLHKQYTVEEGSRERKFVLFIGPAPGTVSAICSHLTCQWCWKKPSRALFLPTFFNERELRLG